MYELSENVEKHNKEICRLEYWVVGGEMFQPQTSDRGSLPSVAKRFKNVFQERA